MAYTKLRVELSGTPAAVWFAQSPQKLLLGPFRDEETLLEVADRPRLSDLAVAARIQPGNPTPERAVFAAELMPGVVAWKLDFARGKNLFFMMDPNGPIQGLVRSMSLAKVYVKHLGHASRLWLA